MVDKINNLFIEITNSCNFKCDFCPSPTLKRSRGFMKPELFNKIIDEVTEKNLADTILFHLMGEPLLHPNFVDFIKLCSEKKQKMHLITNTSFLKENNIEPILKYVDTLEISLQSFDEKSFGQRRASKNLIYEQFLEISKNIIEKKLQMGSKTIIDMSLIEDSGSLIKNFRKDIHLINTKKEVKSYFEEHWNDFFTKMSKEHNVPFNKLDKVKKNIFRHKKIKHEFLPGVYVSIRGITTWANNLTESKKVIPAIVGKCDALIYQLGILWNGNIVPCCMDFEGEIILGNITNSPLVKVMESEYYNKLKSGFKKGKLHHPYCKKCRGGPTLTSWAFNQASSFVNY